MGAGSDPPDGEDEVRDEGYHVDTEEGRKFVIFDPKNPLAWIISDWFGTPPDAEADEEEAGESEPTE
jgi:hypothetical protein